MRLHTACILLLVASVHARGYSEKEKRRAQTYFTSSKPVYSGGPTASAYASARDGPKINYVQQQPVSYDRQQITVQQPVKISYNGLGQSLGSTKFSAAALAQAAPQQQFSYSFAAQPDTKLSFVQSGSKYVLQPETGSNYVQPATSNLASIASPAKVAYQSPGSVSYTQQPIASKPHYSPADSVSSFKFTNPYVSYSNHGLLSQTVGKSYTSQQPAAAPQFAYTSSPQAPAPQYVTSNSQQYSGAPQFHYTSSPQEQIQYSSTPEEQYSSGQQLQYSSGQQYSAAPQVQYVSAQQLSAGANQGAHSSASTQYLHTLPQGNFGSTRKGSFSTPGISYA